jgi:predicted nucleic-acid-binding Zn-ribbon protein
MIMELPPYNPESSCRKCGNEQPTLEYHEKPVHTLTKTTPCSGLDIGEHHDRRCTACGYAWCEGVLS